MSNLLEREYDDLRSQRVALRQRREQLVKAAGFAPQNRYGVDGYDNAIAMTEAALRGTERRWLELCTLLHKPLSGPPVKLDAPVRRHSATTRQPGPYLNRMISTR